MSDQGRPPEKIPEGSQVEGPDPGSAGMRSIMREAEERADESAARREREDAEPGSEARKRDQTAGSNER